MSIRIRKKGETISLKSTSTSAKPKSTITVKNS